MHKKWQNQMPLAVCILDHPQSKVIEVITAPSLMQTLPSAVMFCKISILELIPLA
jgi:hypothetical protein